MRLHKMEKNVKLNRPVSAQYVQSNIKVIHKEKYLILKILLNKIIFRKIRKNILIVKDQNLPIINIYVIPQNLELL